MKKLIILLIILFAIVLIRNAWLCADAFIGLRIVDNFVNGYGLRYNIIERVNAFTPPLWIFVISSIYYFTHEGYFTLIFLCMFLSIMALIVYSRINPETCFLGLIVLTLSKAFIDYSTSGLENALSHLLLAIIFYIYLLKPEKVYLLSLASCLFCLNRLDGILIVAPMLIHVLCKTKKYAVILLGFIPLVLWELFSLFYYGFPFPNVYYAKACSGIPHIELAKQGLLYFMDSINHDPVTLLVIFTAIVIGFYFKGAQNKIIAMGITIYLLYVVSIGGCYMSGRFFTMPLFCSCVLLSRVNYE